MHGRRAGDGADIDPVPRETLLLGTQAGPIVVEIPSGSMLFERPGTVASLGGSWLSSATRAEGSTLLEAVDGSTAEPTSALRLDGSLDVRVVSESGGSVALMDPLPDGWDPAVPLPRSRTQIVVADPTGSTETRTYDLRGNFEPEAFSTDDRQLFLIQHLPAEAPTVYRVTMLNLGSGRVRPVFGPFKGPAERMPGIRLQQVLSPNADQLYTLYSSAARVRAAPGTRREQRDGVVRARAEPAGRVGALRRPAEAAVGPSGGRAGDGHLAERPSPLHRGRDARARDRHGHGVARDPDCLDRPRRDGRPPHLGRRELGRLVAVRRDRGERGGITRIDTDTFDVVRSWTTDDVSGLGLSSDGRRLYVAFDDRVEVLDARPDRSSPGSPSRAPPRSIG